MESFIAVRTCNSGMIHYLLLGRGRGYGGLLFVYFYISVPKIFFILTNFAESGFSLFGPSFEKLPASLVCIEVPYMCQKS